jgi:hypothetical protein
MRSWRPSVSKADLPLFVGCTLKKSHCFSAAPTADHPETHTLEATDPDEAASLMHVARRWVLQALPHVPQPAREGFVSEVAVNRLLLSRPD